MQNELNKYLEEVKALKDNAFMIIQEEKGVLDIVNSIFPNGEIAIKEIKGEITKDGVIEIFKEAVSGGKPLFIHLKGNIPEGLHVKLDEYIEDNFYIHDGEKWTLLKKPSDFYIIFCLFAKDIEEKVEILSGKFDSRLLSDVSAV